MAKTEKKVATPAKIAIPKKLTLPKIDLNKLREKFNTDKVVKTIVLALILVFSFALVDLLVQYLNNSYSVAIVNGVRITRGDFYNRLEKTYGLSTTKSLIQEELVTQGAAKEGVAVTEDDIQKRLNDYYNENGGRDAVLATLKANNFTEQDVREQIKIGLLMEKVLAKRVSYTDKELEDFFKQYKDVLYGTEKVKFEDKKAEIVEYYVNKSVQDLKEGWLAELEAAAKVQNNVANVPKYGFLKTSTTIVKNLYTEISNQLKSN
ncbi:SurA N-terminal domain-containing protein [bacterium]|nr:SurA N-terminal domain-containing protein [bacterium]